MKTRSTAWTRACGVGVLALAAGLGGCGGAPRSRVSAPEGEEPASSPRAPRPAAGARLWTWPGQPLESLTDIAVDEEGAIYVAGAFGDTVDFDPGPGVQMGRSEDHLDAFVLKLGPGGELEWVATLGGSGQDRAEAVDVSPSGSVIVVGSYYGTIDLDPGDGAIEHDAGEDRHSFVVSLDRAGALQWAASFASSEHVQLGAVFAGAGRTLLAGTFGGTVDLDPGPGQDLRTAEERNEAVVLELGSDGRLRWATTFGGIFAPEPHEVALLPDGSVVAAGTFTVRLDLDPGPSRRPCYCGGDLCAFALSLDRGGALRWSVALEGVDEQEEVLLRDLAVTPDGTVVLAASFTGTVDLDPGPEVREESSEGLQAALVLALDDGGRYRWSRVFQAPRVSSANAVAASPEGSVFVTGHFLSRVGLDPDSPAGERPSRGDVDLFAAAIEGDGTLAWSETLGGPGPDIGAAVDVLSDGTPVFAGHFCGEVDLDPGPGVLHGVARCEGARPGDLFVVRAPLPR